MADAARVTGPALEAHFQFILWLVPTVEKFPRQQKFLLGDRIQTTALDVLEFLVEATYTRDRRSLLARANLGIEKLRFFCRLAVELKHLDGAATNSRRVRSMKLAASWAAGERLRMPRRQPKSLTNSQISGRCAPPPNALSAVNGASPARARFSRISKKKSFASRGNCVTAAIDPAHT